MSSVLRVEAMRLDIRYAAQICNAPLSDLSHPTVVPQTWAPKASRLVLAVSIKLQSFFLVSTLCFLSPCHRIHCSGWSTTAVCHGVPSCRQSCSVLPLPLCSFTPVSIRKFRANARSHHSSTTWAVDADWDAGLVYSDVGAAASNRGQRVCKVVCWRCAHCDLDLLVQYSAV
jgi:hypothetical protein